MAEFAFACYILALGLGLCWLIWFTPTTQDLKRLQHQIRLLRKEVAKMAITQDDVKTLAESVGRLVDITQAAIAAAAGDRDAKDAAVAELQTLRGEVAWLNDPELDQKIDDMIAAAAAATPAQ